MQTRYEKEAFQFLAVFRFLSYALAVMFTQVPASPLNVPVMPTLQLYIILISTLGVYTVLRVFSPLHWRERSLMTYLILIGDFLLCMLLVIYTNGLNSPFLLYSLTPIMTATATMRAAIAIDVRLSECITSRGAMRPKTPTVLCRSGWIKRIRYIVTTGANIANPIMIAKVPAKLTTKSRVGYSRVKKPAMTKTIPATAANLTNL